MTHRYEPDGVAPGDWEELTTPVEESIFLDVEMLDETRWYASAVRVDVEISAGMRPGIIRSTDRGGSWAFIHDGIGPSNIVWSMTASAAEGTPLYLGMWGGGLLRLTDPP